MSSIVLKDVKVKLSNENKTMFPGDELVKSDVIDYYYNISENILPHLNDRPVMLQRFPNGIDHHKFYQKEVPKYFPPWIDRIDVEVHQKTKSKGIYVNCNKLSTLLFLANKACISLHPWLSRKKDLYKPDKIIFDLDPPMGKFKLAREGALEIKKFFDELHVNTYVMTTGSKGLHVIIPIKPTATFDETREIAKHFASIIEKKDPGKFTTEMSKEKRRNKLFLDYLRNSYGQSAIAPYSLRPIAGAPVAAPLEWEELDDHSLHAQSFNSENIFDKLIERGDPFEDLHEYPHDIKELHKKSGFLINIDHIELIH